MLYSIDNDHNKRTQVIENLGQMGEDVTFKTDMLDMTYKGLASQFSPLREIKTVKGKKLLINANTGEQLSVVGEKYNNPYSHAEQFQAIEKRIISSKLDLTDMKREVSVSHDGARAYARYSFPSHTIEVGKTGPVSLDILCRNSFDGSWPTIFEGGAERWACLNKCVFGTAFAVSKQRHTKNINYEKGAVQVMNCLEAFMKESEKWNEWINTPVKDEQAFEVIALLSRNQYAIGNIDMINNSTTNMYEVLRDATKNKNGDERRHSPLATLWTLWKTEYKPSLGGNLWSLYNVLTDWSTKCQAPSSSSPATVTSLQTEALGRVRKVITTNNVFRLAA